MKREKTQKGITLIALIITVIVLLILAGTAISIAVNGESIFGKANTAANAWNSAVARENTAINEVWDILKNTGEISIKMTLNNHEETLTKDNFAQHLGKLVTKYNTAVSGKTSVKYTSTAEGAEEETYTVSDQYRLYWIDFEGIYGERGTIYLKADCTSNNYDLGDSLNNVLNGASETANGTTSKLINLNPSLNNNTSTITANPNMSAVRWLTDTEVWKGLKASTGITASSYYVVGAPSIEMMVDSYNAYYTKKGAFSDTEKAKTTPVAAGSRSDYTTMLKLFSKYTSGDNGYQVGPGSSAGFANYTADYTVKNDTDVNSMYYPGASNYYWLASPSAGSDSRVVIVSSYWRGLCDRRQLL